MKNFAFVFPGQGSQKIGMGKELYDNFPAAKHVFKEVNDAIGKDIYKLMIEGSPDELNLTLNTQPAIMAVSLAAVKALESEGIKLFSLANFFAGHSLGEYSALAASESITLYDVAKLLKIRGNAMNNSVPHNTGKMAAIIGLEIAKVRKILEEPITNLNNQICEIANDNSNQQCILSGHKELVDAYGILAKEAGAKRVLSLPVSAPFHCKLMRPAEEPVANQLEKTEIKVPIRPIIKNVDAKQSSDPDIIKESLIKQICSTVRWRESILYLAQQNITKIVEIGPGNVLSGLTKRIDNTIETINIRNKDDIKNFISFLSK